MPLPVAEMMTTMIMMMLMMTVMMMVPNFSIFKHQFFPTFSLSFLFLAIPNSETSLTKQIGKLEEIETKIKQKMKN